MNALRILLLTLLAALPPLGPALAAPACHCFQERSYDPAAPGAITPYLLATSHNSLFAVAFGESRRAVVQARMGGVSATDLWLSYALAPALGRTPEALRSERARHPSWAQLAAALALHPEAVDPLLFGDITAGRSDEELADRLLVTVLARDFGLPASATLPLLRSGLERRELTLAAYLALREGHPPAQFLTEARSLPGGWGELALHAGLDPQGFEAGWRALRRPSP